MQFLISLYHFHPLHEHLVTGLETEAFGFQAEIANVSSALNFNIYSAVIFTLYYNVNLNSIDTTLCPESYCQICAFSPLAETAWKKINFTNYHHLLVTLFSITQSVETECGFNLGITI